MCIRDRYLTNNFNFRIGGEFYENFNVFVIDKNRVEIECLTWLNKNSGVKDL